jgi:hygromycin-B 7''-O-kinase
MNNLLPRFRSDTEYDSCEHTAEMYLPAIHEICANHGLSYTKLEKFDEGESAIVFSVDEDLGIKLCPQLWADQVALETTVLNHIGGRLATPTPRVVQVGDLEGWAYFIMTKLSGRRLNAIAQSLTRHDLLDLYAQMGASIRQLHSLPELNADLPVPDWREFVISQCAGCPDHHRKGGVRESLVEQIPSFLDTYLPDPDDSYRTAILHTELSPGEWFIEQRSGSWVLSGLFDFGDVLLGDCRADSIWCVSDLSLLKSYFSGYGHKDGLLSEDFACTMLAYALLHRYATLTWYFQNHLGILERAVSLKDLALKCFPIA